MWTSDASYKKTDTDVTSGHFMVLIEERAGPAAWRPRSLGLCLQLSLSGAPSPGAGRVDGLEVSTGKVSLLQATNGSTVLLPCTYSSCIGIHKLYFNWHYNDNGTMLKLCEAVIPKENVEPVVGVYHERVEFVGSSRRNNISILLWNITFEDRGDYVCFARNPKEKNRNHSAVYTLIVVEQLTEVDTTLTTVMVAVVGTLLGSLLLFMVAKALVVNFMPKKEDKNKDCLVSSTVVDHTEDTRSGAKGSKGKA
ncbi:sodium channel, voltage-gated, type IV, beta a [Gadus macrocephalus]|uniref:sodium channel, voltage-gated, type IV, beta a n=1 Tax=Gadus macrocephalus TaxID=80720 RepID=UPI0028CB5451|nr:sodium channel, voltage-gated, type IV, beta a [Gadus macrocephalus]